MRMHTHWFRDGFHTRFIGGFGSRVGGGGRMSFDPYLRGLRSGLGRVGSMSRGHLWAAMLFVVAFTVAGCGEGSSEVDRGAGATADRPAAESARYGSGSEAAGGAVAAAGEPLESLPPEATQTLSTLLNAYFEIGDALAEDSLDDVGASARLVGDAAEELFQTDIPSAPNFWHEHAEQVRTIAQQAEALRSVPDSTERADAADLEAARAAYGEMSDALDRLVKASGVPGSYHGAVQGFVCGMVEGVPRGGVWLQPVGEPRNPYYGSEMLRCYSEEYPLAVTGSGSG